jgi:tRNA pseudouridine38-40 synthase
MRTLLVAAASSAAAACRYRARVAYDGTGYAGMQYQMNAPTVQGVLQAALGVRSQLSQVRVVAAGRTDAGVHARGQAVHFELGGVDLEPQELERALGRLLPADVAVSRVERAAEVDATGRPWHAIYWATGKQYTYRLHSGCAAMDPTQRLYRHHFGRSALNLTAMAQAAKLFEGEHDFGAFSNLPRGAVPGYGDSGAGSVRRVAAVCVVDEGSGYGRIEVELKGALYKMVRNMVGALVDVGLGRVGADTIAQLLADPSRRLRRSAKALPDGVSAGSRGGGGEAKPGGGGAGAGLPGSAAGDPNWPRPAPAHGLTLESVFYGPPAWGGAYAHPVLLETVGARVAWSDAEGEAGVLGGGGE